VCLVMPDSAHRQQLAFVTTGNAQYMFACMTLSYCLRSLAMLENMQSIACVGRPPPFAHPAHPPCAGRCSSYPAAPATRRTPPPRRAAAPRQSFALPDWTPGSATATFPSFSFFSGWTPGSATAALCFKRMRTPRSTCVCHAGVRQTEIGRPSLARAKVHGVQAPQAACGGEDSRWHLRHELALHQHVIQRLVDLRQQERRRLRVEEGPAHVRVFQCPHHLHPPQRVSASAR
jgi:hypothetical protein